MKTLLLVLSAVLALASVPAEARVVVHPHVHFGLGFGVPYDSFGWYDPWFYPSPYWYEPVPRRGETHENATENLFVYPAHGQTDEQTAQDRKECNDWAVTQSGLDPATAKKRAKAQHMGDYNRAFTACMEGRNYTVK